MDTHFVKTAELAKHVRLYVEQYDTDGRGGGIAYLVGRMRPGPLPRKLSATGEYNTIRRILDIKFEYTELKVADKVLTAIDCNYLIPAGEIKIYTGSEVRK